jgi:thymidine kinase
MSRKGKLIVVSGPTGSGKSEYLEKELASYHYTHSKVIAIRSKIDTRETNGNAFSTHRADLAEAKRLPLIQYISVDKLSEVEIDNWIVFGIDEGQFFPDLERVLEWVMKHGKIVIVSGLTLDFRGQPFNSIRIKDDPHVYARGMQTIMDHADKTKRLFATCVRCLEEHKKKGTLEEFNVKNAMYSARLTHSNELIEIGGADKYAAMCREHFMKHYNFEFYHD